MKTTPTISISEFAKQLGVLAEQVNEKYYSVSYKQLHTPFTESGIEHEFSCYINPGRLVEGKTPNECIDKMKKLLFPKKNSIIKDVVVLEGDLS